MKTALLLIPVVAMLAACGTTRDAYERRADNERERQERYVDKALDKAPKWMYDVPISNSAVYASGTNTSSSWEMAVHKAKADAFGKICMTAGGSASQNTKLYRADKGQASTELSEMVIKTNCNRVDLTGVEVAKDGLKVVSEGTTYRAYVLVVLPTGDANILRKAKEQAKLNEIAAQRAPEAFKELDKQ